MIIRDDPVCQLMEEEIRTITNLKTVKKAKRISKSTLSKAFNLR